MSEARSPKFDGTTNARWSKPSLSDFLNSSRAPEGAGDVADVSDAPENVRTWIAGHSLLGDPSADTFDDMLVFPVVDPATGDLNANALRAVMSGRGAQADIPEGALESARAVAQRLLEREYAERDEERGTLSGVEIFRAGTWNGDKYSTDDLDEMVRAFGKTGFRPPVKLGHRERSGEPAMGWVANLRRVGEKLVADLEDIPKRVFKAIKDRKFDSVSSEIFWNLKRNGKTFKRALKAVAILGAEIPAVADLKPLRESFDVDAEQYDAVHAYQLSTEKIMAQDDKGAEALDKLTESVAAIGETLQKFGQRLDGLEAAGKGEKPEDKTGKAKQNSQKSNDDDKSGDAAFRLNEQQEQIKALEAKVEEAQERERKARIQSAVDNCRIPALRDIVASLYDMATSAEPDSTVKFKTYDQKGNEVVADVHPTKVVDNLVERMNKHTEKLFREVGATGGFKRDDAPRDEDPGVELDRLTRKYMADHTMDETKYTEAFQAVLNDPENADLKSAYGGRSE